MTYNDISCVDVAFAATIVLQLYKQQWVVCIDAKIWYNTSWNFCRKFLCMFDTELNVDFSLSSKSYCFFLYLVHDNVAAGFTENNKTD